MSSDGNGRNAVPEWIRGNLSTIVLVSAGVVAAWAVQIDRADRTRVDLVAAEQRLNERFTALSVRLTKNEEFWQLERDKNLQQTNDLLSFQARLHADQETRDVRSKARDDQIDGIQADVRALQESDRETGQWQATITERLTNMSAQLGQLVRLLDQRLPDAPPDKDERRRP